VHLSFRRNAFELVPTFSGSCPLSDSPGVVAGLQTGSSVLLPSRGTIYRAPSSTLPQKEYVV
jgi:hypothetical protein